MEACHPWVAPGSYCKRYPRGATRQYRPWVGSLVHRYRVDGALVLLLVILELAGFGQDPGIGAPSTALEMLPLLSLLFRRSAPAAVAVTYLLANVASAVLGLHALNSAPTVIAIVVGVYSAGAYLPLPWALTTLGVWVAGLAVDFVAGREEGGAGDLAFAALLLAAAFTPGAIVRGLRSQADASARAAHEAISREANTAAEAVAGERARIALELHDVVAHAVSIMVMQAAAADELLDTDPKRAHVALGAVQQAGRSAVAELARMLDLLRGARDDELAPLPTLDGIPALAEEARRAGADVTISGNRIGQLAPGVQLCAYRVVQEALTNAGKHTIKPHVHIALERTDSDLVVLVEDDGGAGSRAAAGTGHGLLGLQERVELFGGTLDAAPRRHGGFRVRAALPLEGSS